MKPFNKSIVGSLRIPGEQEEVFVPIGDVVWTVERFSTLEDGTLAYNEKNKQRVLVNFLDGSSKIIEMEVGGIIDTTNVKNISSVF